MRSSVGYMLSHAAGETVMSEPDYQQDAYHHAALLILIRGIGNIPKSRALQTVFERIQCVNHVRIAEPSRDIWVRFVRDHPVENNDWGDFQTHRRLVGLITVGAFDNQLELNELCRVHESLKVKYVNTLFDSRCVLFGPNRITEDNVGHPRQLRRPPPQPDVISCSSSSGGGSSSNASTTAVQHHHPLNYDSETNSSNKSSQPPTLESLNSNSSGTDHPDSRTGAATESDDEEVERAASPMTSKKLESFFVPPSNFKSTAFFYPENDPCLSLESNMVEFVESLFWILESKRLERTREKIDKVSLLLAPFEKKDFVGLDMESRNNKKRCIGRVTKHLADLTLQAGLVADSLTLYHAAAETLRAISDSLWLGAAYEGLCAASAILLYPRPMTRYTDNIITPTSTTRRQAHNNNTSNNKDSSSVSLSTSPSISSTSSVASTLSSNSSTTNSSSSVTAHQQQHQVADVTSSATVATVTAAAVELPVNILKPDQITNHYRDAIINYSKYRHAGIIETEAALKAARICIEQRNNLDVAMFLQSVLYINLTMSEQVRVLRFETLTGLYQRIGYNRKAAFCQRLAAWRYVGQSNHNPDWSQSYRLMLESFPGHRLSLDPIEVLTSNAGWPCLQIDLLQQLVTAAKRLGHSALATRHMTFLLQTMWPHLSAAEQREMCHQLQSLSAQCEGSPVALNLENGTVIPAANLTDLPLCTMFQVKELASHLRPNKIDAVKVDQGPFLFTPIHFNSMDRKRDQKEDAQKGKLAFEWVQYDMCEVTIKVTNPLPFDVQLGDMRLLTTGVVFESMPQTVTLPPKLATYVTLHGSPIECGLLHIEGYSTHTLGVRSDCRLKYMFGRSFPQTFQVNVIPGMPKLKLQTSLPQTATFSMLPKSDNVITSANVTLFNGESTDCTITITNCSNIPIEYLDGIVHAPGLGQSTVSRMFRWDQDAVHAQLPILPHESKQFVLRVFAEADFLGPVVLLGTTAAAVNEAALLNEAAGGSGPSSLPAAHNHHHHRYNQSSSISGSSFLSSPNNTIRRNDLRTSSFRSTQTTSNTIHSSSTTGHDSLVTMSLMNMPMTAMPRQVEAQLRLRYSGGDGLKRPSADRYCRQCTIAMNVDLMPSAQITNWDVLPAEVASEFYLVLDVVNLTTQEMSLEYTDAKNILIEAKESCRVPVPVPRCPLDKIKREVHVLEAQAARCVETMGSVLSGGTDVDHTERVCSKHVADSVDLRWTLTGTANSGIASLRGITLSPVMLDLVTVAPLQWEVFADRVPVPPQAELNCTTGQCLTLGVCISNTSAAALHHLTLSIRFYQDYQNGVHNYVMETRISTSGPNEYHVPVLEPNEKASHEISVIFFNAGRFKADIQCRSLSTMTHCSTNVTGSSSGSSSCSNNNNYYKGSNASNEGSQPIVLVNHHHHPPSNTRTMGHSNYNATVAAGDCSQSHHNTTSGHTWRFIPSVEITVVE